MMLERMNKNIQDIIDNWEQIKNECIVCLHIDLNLQVPKYLEYNWENLALEEEVIDD